jgi:hypothetical protein
MKFRNRLIFGALVSLLIGSAGRAGSASIVTEWSPLVIGAVIRRHPAPTIGSHLMAMVFTAAYDAWSAYDPMARAVHTGNTLDVEGRGTPAEQEEAVSHAIYAVLSFSMPADRPAFDGFMAAHGFSPGSSTRAAAIGRAAAKAVIGFRTRDGCNYENGYADTTGYAPRGPSMAGAWQPLSLNGAVQAPLTPHWGRVIPFAAGDSDRYRLPPPAAPGSPEWDAQIGEIIAASAGLTDRRKAIVEFWRPMRGSPPMLLARLTEQVSRGRGFSLEEDVRLFFAVHNALMDAAIRCWEVKFRYDYVRPITAVRRLGDVPIVAWRGPRLGIGEMPASRWSPYQPRAALNDPTPPFPEYPSGHSTFSAAWAEVMEACTGSEVFGGSAEIASLAIEGIALDAPIRLDWPTYRAAAEEAGVSRIYGGIHFTSSNLRGQELGRAVGEAVWRRCEAYWSGAAAGP